MSYRPKAYPHPVLSEVSDDYVDGSEFFGVFSHSTANGYLTLRYDLTLNCVRLDEVRADQFAQLALEIECPGVRWKKLFTVDGLAGSIDLPESNLFGTVKVTPVLVACEEVNLELSGINAEFKKNTFHIFTGDLLAFGPTEAVESNHDRSSNDNHYGIKFAIQADLKDAEYRVDCDYDEIIIYCGKGVMRVVQGMTTDARLAPLVFMTFYKDAFVHGMINMLGSLERGEELEQTWAKGLKAYIDQSGLSLDELSGVEEGNREAVERFVQRLIAADGVEVLSKRAQKGEPVI
jgi:hypothetical protein